MRTLNEQIQRVKDALVTCYNAIKRKGGTIPEAGERTLLNMPAAVLSIPQTHGVMTELNVTANGEYLPSDYDADGFSKVTAEFDSDRDMYSGCNVQDGISLINLLCSNSNQIEEITDTNIGWTYLAENSKVNLVQVFPNLKRLTIGAVRLGLKDRILVSDSNSKFYNGALDSFNAPYLEMLGVDYDYPHIYDSCTSAIAGQINSDVIYLPSLKIIHNSTDGLPVFGTCPNCKKILLPALEDIRTPASGWLGKNTGTLPIANAPECLELITNIGGNTNRNNNNTTGYYFIKAQKLRKFILGGELSVSNDNGLWNTKSTDLIHLEIGGAHCSLFMQSWNPTNAFRTDTTAEDYIDLRENTPFANNLEQFLYNFQTYIADRVADRTGTTALTLTLSPAVYAVLEAQEGQTILATLTNKNWNVAQA